MPLIVVLGSKFVGQNEIVYWVVYLDGSYLSVGLKSFKSTDVTKLTHINWQILTFRIPLYYSVYQYGKFDNGPNTTRICSVEQDITFRPKLGHPLVHRHLKTYRVTSFFYKEFYNRTILNCIHFKGYIQHSCFRQQHKTNY